MADFQSGSRSSGSSDPEDLREHSHETGRVGPGEEDGIKTAETVDQAEPIGGKSGKLRLAAEYTGVLMAASVIACLSWKIKALTKKNEVLNSVAGSLLVQLAEAVATIDYLKSASGAGATLNGFRER